MMRLSLDLGALAAVVALGGACTGHWPAPPGAQLEIPETLSIGWDPNQGGDPERYNVLYPLSARVTDEFGNGYNGVEVSFFSPTPGIYLLPESVIKIAVPEAEDGTNLAEDQESGWYDPDPEDGYPFAEFIGEFEDDYKPTYYQGVTNGQGVAAVWMWIEDLPVSVTDDGEVSAEGTHIVIDIGVTSDIFEIEATSG